MSKHVTVYTNNGCQPCLATKRWLKKREIDFREVNLAESPQDLEAVRALGYQQAPVVIVTENGEDFHWGDFRPDLLEQRAA